MPISRFTNPVDVIPSLTVGVLLSTVSIERPGVIMVPPIENSVRRQIRGVWPSPNVT